MLFSLNFDKKIHICSYGLFPDEKYENFDKLLNILKNIYKFISKIVIIDF